MPLTNNRFGCSARPKSRALPWAPLTWKTWRWPRPSSARPRSCAPPVILQTTPSTVRYAGTGMYAAMVAALAQEATVPVAMHLDHGDSFAPVRPGFALRLHQRDD